MSEIDRKQPDSSQPAHEDLQPGGSRAGRNPLIDSLDGWVGNAMDLVAQFANTYYRVSLKILNPRKQNIFQELAVTPDVLGARLFFCLVALCASACLHSSVGRLNILPILTKGFEGIEAEPSLLNAIAAFLTAYLLSSFVGRILARQSEWSATQIRDALLYGLGSYALTISLSSLICSLLPPILDILGWRSPWRDTILSILAMFVLVTYCVLLVIGVPERLLYDEKKKRAYFSIERKLFLLACPLIGALAIASLWATEWAGEVSLARTLRLANAGVLRVLRCDQSPALVCYAVFDGPSDIYISRDIWLLSRAIEERDSKRVASTIDSVYQNDPPSLLKLKTGDLYILHMSRTRLCFGRVRAAHDGSFVVFATARNDYITASITAYPKDTLPGSEDEQTSGVRSHVGVISLLSAMRELRSRNRSITCQNDEPQGG